MITSRSFLRKFLGYSKYSSKLAKRFDAKRLWLKNNFNEAKKFFSSLSLKDRLLFFFFFCRRLEVRRRGIKLSFPQA